MTVIWTKNVRFGSEADFERAGIRFIDADGSGGIGVRLELARPKKRSKTKG